MRGKLRSLVLRRVGRRKPTTRYASGGFTLTEATIASVLLIVAMVPILRALTTAQVTATIIEHRTCSLALAEQKLDEIRARSIYDYAGDFTESDLLVEDSYLCRVTDSAQTSELRRIEISVGYDANGNGSLEETEVEVTLATLLARRW
ncbi:MAG: hypothetical protein ACYTEL_02725 [Planctomycetota bacterium]|jgi:Tfp pilus assembly protein PilV